MCWDLSVVDWGQLWGSSEWTVRVDVEERPRFGCGRVRAVEYGLSGDERTPRQDPFVGGGVSIKGQIQGPLPLPTTFVHSWPNRWNQIFGHSCPTSLDTSARVLGQTPRGPIPEGGGEYKDQKKSASGTVQQFQDSSGNAAMQAQAFQHSPKCAGTLRWGSTKSRGGQGPLPRSPNRVENVRAGSPSPQCLWHDGDGVGSGFWGSFGQCKGPAVGRGGARCQGPKG